MRGRRESAFRFTTRVKLIGPWGLILTPCKVFDRRSDSAVKNQMRADGFKMNSNLNPSALSADAGSNQRFLSHPHARTLTYTHSPDGGNGHESACRSSKSEVMVRMSVLLLCRRKTKTRTSKSSATQSERMWMWGLLRMMPVTTA